MCTTNSCHNNELLVTFETLNKLEKALHPTENCNSQEKKAQKLPDTERNFASNRKL